MYFKSTRRINIIKDESQNIMIDSVDKRNE